ncbi:MAG: ABC transporter permease [Dehalococcoidia bacterium]
MSILRYTFILMMRAIREALRQPGIEIGNVFIPLFFFFVIVGALESVASSAFGVDDFVGFQLPVALLQAVAVGTAGSGLVSDIQRGYFDKLALTPAPRAAIVLGRMAGDGVRAAALGSLMLIAGLLAGANIEAGPLGAVVLVGMGVVFSLAYSGLGVALALRTASNQAVQLSFILFFPLLFLSPSFAPKEVYSGWLKFLVTINPFTYVLEGCRALVLDGWDGPALLKAFAAITGLALVTMSMTVAAYGHRKA